jgi:RNA polymerase sigma-70 factor, ECF subfamily
VTDVVMAGTLPIMAERLPAAASEMELLSRAQAGDRAAFERIVALYERRIFALALRLAGAMEDAKDATQETFLRLHRNLRQIDSGHSLGPWLWSVAVNACRDIGRHRRRSRLVPIDAFVSANAADPSSGPEGLASAHELERRLQTALRQLPEKERAALLLREMEGLSTCEVAEILGSSETTVRSQISTARMRLRKLLGYQGEQS